MKQNPSSFNRTRSTARPSFARLLRQAILTLTVSAGGFAGTAQLHACDACNLVFADQVLSDRADTLIGKDLRRAMENQKNLNLDGMVDKELTDIQVAKLEAANAAQSDEAQLTSMASDMESEPACPNCAAGIPCAPEAQSDEAVEVIEVATAQGASVAARANTLWQQASTNLSTSAPAPAKGHPLPDYMKSHEFIEIIERDYALDATPYSTVPQDAPVDKQFTVTLTEGKTYIGNGVVYDGFLIDGKIPGPTLIVDQGDVVEMTIVNDGSIPHGASIHAAYTQTSKYVGKIGPKSSKSVRFRAMMPGVYMYHCAPGGHAIGMHVLGGQYGMIVVKPPAGSYEMERQLGHEPNLELYMVQHELYSSGKDAIAGDPEYVLFNGRTYQYVEDPIMAKPGDYVRMYFLNVGPNILSTFHIVGIIWDYIYWQGNPDVKMPGGQSITAGPTDSFVIEFRMPPDEGAYTMLTHAVGSTNRGAIGLIVVDDEAELEPHRTILADGPSYKADELNAYIKGATRTISPFGIGTHKDDRPVVYGPETEEVFVEIIGNSFYPKVIEIAPGTKVTWTNEDTFTYLAGEYAGIHNVQSTSSPEDSDGINGPLLAHGESWSYTFDQEWEYDYICTPHPYMMGKVIVKAPEYSLSSKGGGSVALGGWVLPLLALCLILATASFAFRGKA